MALWWRHFLRPPLRNFVPLFVCLLPCLFVELFSFWAASILWHVPRIAGQNSVIILVVADPQLIGHINEPKWVGRISRWDADRFLRRGYAFASRTVRPDLELFLGDLFDEGVLLGDDERQFVSTRDRFLSIFPLDKRSTNRIYLAGDNDIGGEMEPVYAHLYERFKQHFPPNLVLNNSGGGTLLEQFLSIYETDWFDVGAIRPICCGPEGTASRGPSVRLLLSHFPVLPHATPKTEQQLRPINVVLSAHDHTPAVYMQWRHSSHQRRTGPGAAAALPDTSITDFQWKWTVSMHAPYTLPLVEFKSPTVSYRMGVPKMGYGLLVVTPFTGNGTALVNFSVLWLPSRYLQLRMFLCLSVVGLLWTALSLAGCCRRCESALRHKLVERRRQFC